MDDFTPLEPLSPEDLNLLIGLAKPMYAESCNVERMTGSNTVVNGRPDDGSMKIKQGLEQIARSVQAPPPVYATRSDPQPQIMVTSLPNNPSMYPTTTLPGTIPHVDPQMELNFDISEQKRTNDLLAQILRKLTDLVSHTTTIKVTR